MQNSFIFAQDELYKKVYRPSSDCQKQTICESPNIKNVNVNLYAVLHNPRQSC